MSKRILLVNDHIAFGGGGDAVFRLERRFLEAQGFEVYTFSHATERPEDATERDFIHLENVSRARRKAEKFLGCPTASRAFRETLEKVKPHLVHLHLLSKYPLSIYAQLEGWPTIQTLHGPGLFCATGWGCLKKNSGECELGVGLKCFARGCVPVWQVPVLYQYHRRMMALAAKRVDRFLCPSRQLLEVVRRFGLSRPEYVPLGIDREFLDLTPSPPAGPPSILFVGALVPQKGPDILLEAFIRLKARRRDVRLRFAGRGEMLPQLKERAEQAGVADSVDFLGFVDRPGLIEEYRRATVLAVPSIWKEQFGMIGPEALACGTPCVGTNIGGIPEWLYDGQWGFLVPPRDDAALEKKLIAILGDNSLRQSFSRAGRDFALSHFGPEQYENNLLRIIHEGTSCRSEQQPSKGCP